MITQRNSTSNGSNESMSCSEQPVQTSTSTEDLAYTRTETPPDSRLLIIRLTDPEWIPQSPMAMPRQSTFSMPKQPAEKLVIALNQRVLEDRKRGLWFVLAYANHGFAVVQLHVHNEWQPFDAYDIPPDCELGIRTNVQARSDVKEYNRHQLTKGGFVETWALHIKPPRRPQRVLKRIAKANGVDELPHYDDEGRFVIPSSTVIKASTHTPQLRATEPSSIEVVLEEHDNVSFTVRNCNDSQEALKVVREIISEAC